MGQCTEFPVFGSAEGGQNDAASGGGLEQYIDPDHFSIVADELMSDGYLADECQSEWFPVEKLDRGVYPVRSDERADQVD